MEIFESSDNILEELGIDEYAPLGTSQQPPSMHDSIAQSPNQHNTLNTHLHHPPRKEKPLMQRKTKKKPSISSSHGQADKIKRLESENSVMASKIKNISLKLQLEENAKKALKENVGKLRYRLNKIRGQNKKLESQNKELWNRMVRESHRHLKEVNDQENAKDELDEEIAELERVNAQLSEERKVAKNALQEIIEATTDLQEATAELGRTLGKQ